MRDLVMLAYLAGFLGGLTALLLFFWIDRRFRRRCMKKRPLADDLSLSRSSARSSDWPDPNWLKADGVVLPLRRGNRGQCASYSETYPQECSDL